MKVKKASVFKNHSGNKPQNQFSQEVRKQAIAQIKDWVAEEFEISGYYARLLAVEIVGRVISDRIDNTAADAPAVLLTNADKVNDLAIDGKKLIESLNEQGDAINKILEEAESLDALEEGNSL